MCVCVCVCNIMLQNPLPPLKSARTFVVISKNILLLHIVKDKNQLKCVCYSDMSKNQWHNNTEYFILTNRDNFLFTKIHFLFCKAVWVVSLKSTDLTSGFVAYTS